MDFGPLWQAATALVAAGAVYGAIRADLKAIHQKQRDQDSRVDRVEDRLNRHIEQGVTHGNAT
ncbi:hypothetical protein [Trinickia symbiotica]|uniref:Uncharacterized protein n=1 Tax=Trinickia symbiotica TaxID=863227 RepID=A0A2N7X9R2_9BURK|nr:hypothetical protein [Trinickia symbiotica]PMS38468.1 hypothetical protein C0Z20_00860 [Trinickia symbiotica]